VIVVGTTVVVLTAMVDATTAVVGGAVVLLAVTELVTEVLAGLLGLIALPMPPTTMITANTPPAIQGHRLRFFGGRGAYPDWYCSGIGPH